MHGTGVVKSGARNSSACCRPEPFPRKEGKLERQAKRRGRCMCVCVDGGLQRFGRCGTQRWHPKGRRSGASLREESDFGQTRKFVSEDATKRCPSRYRCLEAGEPLSPIGTTERRITFGFGSLCLCDFRSDFLPPAHPFSNFLSP